MRQHSYEIYGLTLKSEIPFPELRPVRIRPSSSPNQVFFRVRSFSDGFSSPMKDSFQGLTYGLNEDLHTVFVTSRWAGSFRIRMDEKIIEWNPSPRGSRDLGRVLLRGRVLGFFLAHSFLRLILHSNILTWGDRPFGLGGPIGSGKSTLTASFLKENLSSLVSDDVAVLEKRRDSFWVHPGAPEIRLWPQVASRLTPLSFKGKRLYPETRKKRFVLDACAPWRFSRSPVRLRALYFLSREDKAKIRIQTLLGKRALMEILRNTYLPIIRQSQILRSQFVLALKLVQQIPIKRITYPSGLGHLSDVRRALVEDLAQIG